MTVIIDVFIAQFTNNITAAFVLQRSRHVLQLEVRNRKLDILLMDCLVQSTIHGSFSYNKSSKPYEKKQSNPRPLNYQLARLIMMFFLERLCLSNCCCFLVFFSSQPPITCPTQSCLGMVSCCELSHHMTISIWLLAVGILESRAPEMLCLYCILVAVIKPPCCFFSLC